MHRTLFPASSLVEVLMSNEMVPKQELKYLSAYHVPGTFLVTEDTWQAKAAGPLTAHYTPLLKKLDFHCIRKWIWHKGQRGEHNRKWKRFRTDW